MLYLLIYSALVFAYGITIFWDSGVVMYLTGLFAFLSVVISFPKAQRLYKVTASIFVIIALITAAFEGIAVVQFPYYMTSTAILIMIFYVLPFINSVIVVGRYDQKVNRLLKTKISHLGQLYQRTALVSFLLGSFLNIGTIPLVVSVLKRNLKEQSANLVSRFISSAMLRGYALCLVWTPMEILVAISIDITGVGYVTLLPYLLLFSLTLLLITFWAGKSYKGYTLESVSGQIDMTAVYKKIASLSFFLILFISIIIWLRPLLNLSFLETVGLVIIPYSFLWALVIKRIRSFLVYGLRTWQARTSSLQNYVVLFLSVGFFISILGESKLMGYLQYPFLILEGLPVLLFIVIQILFLGLAMVGFHPLVTISLVGEMLQPILGSVSPLAAAIVLITSGLSTVMAGPFNISVSLTGMLLHQNPYRVSLWNVGFAFLFSSGGTLLATIILLFP
ncbi:hypothetical protein ACE1TI_16590 [Alteribacillus sp. JSM 102045]|uniref:hypothetical protein n=1 Tax=Alteribacillus sp. JSM 102045 TaxID=1562101 RepID=UPI0035C18BAA